MHSLSDPPFGKFTRQAGKFMEAASRGYLGFSGPETWQPNVDLYETPGAYCVCVDLAGVDKDKIDLTVHEGRLSITGNRPMPAKLNAPAGCDRAKVHLMEIDHGVFVREVELPADVAQEGITAEHRNGMLWIELPKRG